MALQTFTAAQVLTAAQMNALQANDYNQTVSAKVASYTLVAADKGTRITMSNASATTITVNTSLFAAGDSLRIQNIGAGACTITAGTATVTSAGPLAIAQWGGGQLFFTSASAAVWFPDAITATAGGLTLITAQTIGSAVSSVTVSSVFSGTYDNYKVTLSGGTSSTDDIHLTLKLGATATGYYMAYTGANYSGASSSIVSNNNVSSWTRAATGFTNGLQANFELNAPNLAKTTTITGAQVSITAARNYAGYLSDTTQYTAFTLTPDAGTITGGTIRVYGYSNS
jgi:hypothetical protein